MFHRVFDVIHCDSLEFFVPLPEARREDFASMEQMARHFCESIGIELQAYDLFMRIPTEKGAQIQLRSGRWVAKQRT